MESESILDTIKAQLGIQPDYKHFDMQLIVSINSAFATLHQLGVGPEQAFSIMDRNAKWESFTNSDPALNSVKTYVYIKTKLIFDTPPTSHARTSLQDMAKEIEWRLNVASDRG